jgi:hypothetical protein
MVTSICENIGGTAIFCGKTIIHIELAIFHKVNYIDPIYNRIKYIEHLIPSAEGGRPPSFNYLPANVRNRKTSSGKHLSSYFARKRCLKNATIIYQNSKNTSNIDNTNENFNQKSTMHPPPYDATIPLLSHHSPSLMIRHVKILNGMMPFHLIGPVVWFGMAHMS